jgi:polyhydroxybutyrate depolymerase
MGDVMNTRTALKLVVALVCLPAIATAIEAARYVVVNRSSDAIVSSGETREYTLHVPPGYDAARPTPLVISIHGAGIWPAAQQALTQWDRVADREGFIVVYPSGRTGQGPRHFDAEDVTFIGDLIDSVQRSHNIDRTRIYANGLSNGGGLSFLLSCTMPHRIAAVGLVAAAHLFPPSLCPDLRPVPMIAFHGTADGDTPYDGGRSGKSWILPMSFPSIPSVTAGWARRNRCAPAPVESRVAADVTRLEYAQCASNAPAVLYTIHGGGHTWPGGDGAAYLPEWFVGTTTQSIDASSVMWEFFKAHTLQK